jgi:hypothetical protein
MWNRRARCAWRTSFAAVLATVGMRRFHEVVAGVRNCASDPPRRAARTSISPPGVTIHDAPITRAAAAAHPAVLSQPATGPC